MTYSSLHNHSMHSTLDGFATPEEYLNKASELKLKAFAITEHGNQYSFVYFDELKKEYPDIKIIYGIELYECDDINIKDKDNKYYHLIALARNEKGRIALNNIVTQSNFKGFYYKPRVDLDMLKPHADNLIILSACMASKIAREKSHNKCIKHIKKYKSIFPHFYLELQSHNNVYDDNKNLIRPSSYYNKKILKLSQDTDTPFVITTDSHAATKEDLYYQARHVQIAHDDETMTESYEGCYLQSEEEIYTVLKKQIGKESVKIGLENTNKIADMIEDVNMPFQNPNLPHFPLPEGYNNNYEYLVKLTEDGWIKRNYDQLPEKQQIIRKERLHYELEIINQMDYEGYFLIVWDFINWAKNNEIMVGSGRGSAGGSIVCYLLGISELDPIKYNLIFERFLNPERISMPDIDLDFSDKVKIVKYLMDKYGENSVCQIINFSYITPVVAIKDVGRILKIPYNICEQISKKFTYETFEKCIENNPDLYEQYDKYKELFDIAGKISGRLRHVSAHAGGVGIVDDEINNYIGMRLGKDNEHIIQVDKKMIEKLGIVKFDILGVSTLKIIQEVVKDININLWDIDINNPKFENDEKTFKLLQEAKTNGVFQVESSGMKDLLLRLKPEGLEDLSAVLALYRPDSMSMLEDYIYYKHNFDEIEYWHEDLKPILEKTYGSIVYQEQIMDIVRVLGNRTYGAADKFRKGIGQKIKELVQEESNKLYQEIIDNGYEELLAKQVSEHLALMGGYSFNKSHSALYSVITMQTAYLKAHYPVYFFKALFNLNKNDYGKLNKYIIDAKNFKIDILVPHINKSHRDFIVKNNKILFGLEAIKGIGEKFVDQILIERNNNGKFKNFNDFKKRLNPNKSQIIALIKAGSFPVKNKKEVLLEYANEIFEENYTDEVFKERKSFKSVKDLKETWEIDIDNIKDKEERLKLFNDKRKEKFDREESNRIFKKENERHKFLEEFSEKYLQEEDFWEFDTLSIFVNENPFEKIQDFVTPFEKVEEEAKGVIVGIVSDITKKKDRHGKQFAYISIYSTSGLMDIICWHTQYKEYQDIIEKGNKLVLLCKKRDGKPICELIKTYNQWLGDKNINV